MYMLLYLCGRVRRRSAVCGVQCAECSVRGGERGESTGGGGYACTHTCPPDSAAYTAACARRQEHDRWTRSRHAYAQLPVHLPHTASGVEETLEDVEHDHARAERDAAALDRLRTMDAQTKREMSNNRIGANKRTHKENRRAAVSTSERGGGRVSARGFETNGGERRERHRRATAGNAREREGKKTRALRARTSKTFLITCGEVSKILGQTKFKMCSSASSQLRPTQPRETCLTMAHAVWRCTASRSINASSTSGAIA